MEAEGDKKKKKSRVQRKEEDDVPKSNIFCVSSSRANGKVHICPRLMTRAAIVHFPESKDINFILVTLCECPENGGRGDSRGNTYVRL